MAKRKSKTTKTKKVAVATPALLLPLGPAMPPRITFVPPRMDVVNYIQWGNLIKKWCKDPKTAPWSTETTTTPSYGDGDLEKLKEQCLDAGVGLTVPQNIKKMTIVVQADDTFVLRLPPQERIEETENALDKGGLYPIPRFYDDAYGLVLNVPKEQLRDFHAQRIGDYVIRLTA